MPRTKKSDLTKQSKSIEDAKKLELLAFSNLKAIDVTTIDDPTQTERISSLIEKLVERHQNSVLSVYNDAEDVVALHKKAVNVMQKHKSEREGHKEEIARDTNTLKGMLKQLNNSPHDLKLLEIYELHSENLQVKKILLKLRDLLMSIIINALNTEVDRPFITETDYVKCKDNSRKQKKIKAQYLTTLGYTENVNVHPTTNITYHTYTSPNENISMNNPFIDACNDRELREYQFKKYNDKYMLYIIKLLYIELSKHLHNPKFEIDDEKDSRWYLFLNEMAVTRLFINDIRNNKYTNEWKELTIKFKTDPSTVQAYKDGYELKLEKWESVKIRDRKLLGQSI
jgi:hypothetical protein